MKPDAYMPYYGNDFEAATKGYRPALKWAFLCALWHYWHHTHCTGLPNDPDYLRSICEVEMADWARTGSIIFGILFRLDEGGQWQNIRCQAIWADSQATYNKRVDSAANARAAKTKGNPDSKVDIKDGSKVDSSLDSNPNPKLQSESESESESDPRTQTNKGRLPSLAEVKTAAGMIGMSETDAESFWNHFEASGWVDKNGNPVVNWQAKMRTWKTRAQAAPLESAHKAAEGGISSAAHATIHSKEYERVLEAIRVLKNGAASDAMGSKFYTPQEKQRLKELNDRAAELRKMLGIKA